MMLEIFGQVNKEIKEGLIKVADKVSEKFFLPKKISVNLSFVSEKAIQELNARTRQIDKVTDVLTYPYVNLKVGEKLALKDYKFDLDENGILTIGDIYICKKRAEQQAAEYGHSLLREICFLFCHGMLHILGYDHETKTDAKLMEDLQDEILTELNITREAGQGGEPSTNKINFKSGFVTILGETNSGKSTLMNKLVGEKVAITSPKTQTTRESILGIYDDDNCQIVFVDTPGYHKRKNTFDDEMEKHIANAVEDTEIVLLMLVADKPLVPQYQKLIERVSTTAKKILLINKVDMSTYEKLYPELAKLSAVAKVDEILPVSALKGTNCEVLIEMIKKYLPTHSFEMRYFPKEDYTDKNLRQMVAEIIREKALLYLDDEVPHGIQVLVTDYQENTFPIHISADLYCEKESHKPIILGKSGEMIKKISTASRKEAEKLIGEQIYLQIFVKVKPNWRNDIKSITELGLKFEG